MRELVQSIEILRIKQHALILIKINKYLESVFKWITINLEILNELANFCAIFSLLVLMKL
ncbi:hypothetical protein BpHYR1_023216 [Brachionus plicatilis]|uniref:Uncharacterized protein n=1 Tax=Brachionus plicatilis TaxID=10195 RepID=A0A3M7PMF7_BRAPC|nr:hypothetical protein BpHYR1_023216 [Brachionus plicatilis]